MSTAAGRLLGAAFLFLIVCLVPAFADDNVTVTLTIHCYPPDANVYWQTGTAQQFLGQADQPVHWTVTTSDLHNSQTMYLQADGYQSFQFNRTPATRDPVDGITLLPNNSWVRFRTFAHVYPVWVAFMALLLAAAGAYGVRLHRRRNEQLRRGDDLETLVALNKDLHIGKIIGGYRILDRLGQGGMATVYRACPAELPDPLKHPQEHVAVKIMLPETAKEGEFVDRFQREVRITTRLSHPNIVRIMDCGEHGGGEDRVFYLAMELMDGQTLQALVAGQALPPEQAMQYLQPLFEGISYAHSQGVIHRDLKPENVMLTRQGVLKVMDFGLARQQVASRKLTRSGTALGTPAYMAPEQIQNSEAPVPASDQYSLGCICYELFTGDVPFHAGDPISLMFKHFSDEPRSMRENDPTLPEELDTAVLRMLAKQAQDRFPDVMAALHAMQQALGMRLSAVHGRTSNREALGMRNPVDTHG